MQLKQNHGQSLIEILVVIALTAILLPALFYALMTSREGKPQQVKRFQATGLLKETQDSLRIIRENGWSAIATPGTYYPVLSGNTWNLVSGTETINGITRQIVISNVNRLNSTIDLLAGSNDPSTKRALLTVSWNDPLVTSISSTLYLTRYLENATYTQTTVDDYETGTYPDLVITNDDDGELILGAGGEGNWCTPELTIAALNLPKSGVANALTAIEGQAFTSTGENSSGVSFARVNIGNSDPPTATLNGTVDGYKTNDVFGQETYAYIATDSNQKPVAYINLSTMTVTGGFSGLSGNAESIFVVNNTGYVTAGNKFYTFDVSNKTITNNTALDSVTLPGTGTAIAVGDSYAYVSISGSSTKMQIINVSNPSNITLAGTADFTAGNGQDVTVNDTGTRAYLVTNGTGNQNAFFIINTETKTGSRSYLSTFVTNPMSPRAVVIVPGNKAVVGGHGGTEYQVINIQSETAPTSCGTGLDLSFNINDLATVLVDGDAYTYLLTTNANAEFQIIEGGPGGNFATNGTYESATFDIGQALAFNRILPTFNEPVGTSVTFQIAVADPVSGNCDNANFVFTGPNGLDTSYYEGNDLVALNDDGIGFENPGRCFRYRAYLSTPDSNSTPIFEQIVINYSY